MQATREAILDAAVDLFESAWFDEVTLGDVARRAGVSQQTVVNHFGSKTGLYRAGLSERFAPRLRDLRGEPEPGDVRAAVRAVARDYEETGAGTWRLLVVAEREPELAEVVEGGRAWHRAWVERAFAPQLARLRGRARVQAATLIATALDVTTWYQLRHVQGLDPKVTTAHLDALVAGLVTRG